MSARMLKKLGCKSKEAVEYKKASRWDVVRANKLAVVLASVGLVIVIAPVVIGIAALYPTSTCAVHTAWIAGGAILAAAVVVAIVSVFQAYKEASD